MIQQSDWTGLKSTLLSAVTDLESVTEAMQVSATRFQRTAFTPRAAAAACVHNGYGHIDGGWHPAGGYLYGDHWRTPDFVRAEKALDVSLPTNSFHTLESFGGKLIRGPGYDTLIPPSHGDHLTNGMYESDTGASFSALSTPPFPPIEAQAMHVHGGYLWMVCGLHYITDSNNPKQFSISKSAYRRTVGGVWSLVNDNLPIQRRSHLLTSLGSDMYVIGGTFGEYGNGSDQIDNADVWKTSDGFLTMTQVGTAPIPTGFARWGVWFNGRYVVGGGRRKASPNYISEVWSTADFANWTQHEDFPHGASHQVAFALTVQGVPTLGVIGGYTNGTGPLGTIHTTTNLAQPWSPRTDSDFWVA